LFLTGSRATRHYLWSDDIDPFTLIAAATTAFKAIKSAVEVGKDISSVGQQLGSWATAIADLDFIANKASNPPWYKSISGSAQSEAIEIYAAKQQVEHMRNELRQYIQYSAGQDKWQEFLSIEAKVRKERADHEHRRAAMIEKITSISLFVLFFSTAMGLALFLFWFAWTHKA
jgi:hypothetical protein